MARPRKNSPEIQPQPQLVQAQEAPEGSEYITHQADGVGDVSPEIQPPDEVAANHLDDVKSRMDAEDMANHTNGMADAAKAIAEDLDNAPKKYKMTVDKVVAKILGKATPDGAAAVARDLLLSEDASKSTIVKAARLILDTADEVLHGHANAILADLAPRYANAVALGEERTYKIQGGKEPAHIKLPVAALGGVYGGHVRVRFNADSTATVSVVQAKAEPSAE